MLTIILQAIVNIFGSIVMGLLSILPDTPFQFSTTNWPEWVQCIGVVIPVAGMISHAIAFAGAVAVYYGIRWILRFVRAIQ